MIRKWDVPLGETVTLPPEAEPIHVAVQDDQFRVWTKDNKGLAMLGLGQTVQWFGTGGTPPPGSGYVGTVHDGRFVWHLFRLPWASENGDSHG